MRIDQLISVRYEVAALGNAKGIRPTIIVQPAFKRLQISADFFRKRAADFSNSHLQIDLQRSCVFQAADDLRCSTGEGLDQIFGLNRFFGLINGASEQYDAVHRGHDNLRVRHGNREHLGDRVHVAANANGCLIDCASCGVRGVDGGLTGAFA